MDKGAHFYKCDFQVHSPRDINWNGDRPDTDENRKIYASAFVKKCRELGLNAIAITDHHDFAFFPYIKEAAENELDEQGRLLPNEDRLIVFPGLELTLSTPSCQAILILDADYPVSNLNQILHLLSITPNSPAEATTAATSAISNTIINGFEELYAKLNAIELLRNRFILLPNLNEGGRHTLLRPGNSEHYRKMPCVGGYVDGLTSQHGIGNNNIVNGKALEWGYKSVAVFQTSDNRRRDFNDLGNYTTWVKWAVPTAEALRQACLAKDTRLTDATPELSPIYITRIDVTNSKFLASFSINFNQQYNALIGGRGTGKSTVLEYLRWGLCDQTVVTINPEEQSEIQKRRQGLIEKTLIPFNGEVRVTFTMNGIKHIIKRSSTSKEILLKIDNNEFEQVKEEDIRRILPIQAYSQKQLSSVGVRTEELKRFIQQPILHELNNLKFQLTDNSKKIRSNYNSFVRKKEISSEIEQYNLEIKSLSNQVKSLRTSLTGISEEDQQTISKKQKYDSEEGIIATAKSDLSVVTNKINELMISIQRYPAAFTDIEGLENQQLLKSIEIALKKKFAEINKYSAELQGTLSRENLKELDALFDQWDVVRKGFLHQYETAKAKTSSNQQQLNEINRIEIRLKELSKSLNERMAVLKEMGSPEVEVDRYRAEWKLLHQEKVALLNEQAVNFSQLSKGLIKAEITKSIDIKQIKNLLINALSGTRIREERLQTLCDSIVGSENPLEKWDSIINELKLLAEFKISEDKKAEYPDTPILSECGFNEGNRTRIIEILTPENWLTMSTSEIEFSPEFRYITSNEMGDEIPFPDASAGQQATALLTVLLSQPGTPLLIDQPEDDIDNRAIDDIVKNIWDAKKKRQLIFTSHNANLVVNGDAELVICFDYRTAGDQTRGVVKSEGAIDLKNIKDEITLVMEGGEKAFRLRKDKYGF